MNLQKNFWASNLKLLRTRKKFSQEFLAEQLDMSRSKYNALENGQTVNPTVEDLIRVSDYFRMSIDSLLRVDMAAMSELKLRELEQGNEGYRTGKELRVLAISVDKENKENLEYVPVKARAGYLAGFSDPEFIAALPKFSLPNLPQGNTFRMFPTIGDSMLPIPEGSDIVGKFIQDWQSLKPRTLCIVILKGAQDFVFKQVTLMQQEVLLESLNKAFAPYKVPVAEILELWQFHSYQTQQVPEPESDLQDIAQGIREIREELRQIKRK